MTRMEMVERLLVISGIRTQEGDTTKVSVHISGTPLDKVTDPGERQFREYEQQIAQQVHDEVAKLMFAELMVTDLPDSMTDDELLETVRFHESAAGKRWVAKKVQLHKDALKITARFAGELGDAMGQLTSKRLHQMTMSIIKLVQPNISFTAALKVAEKVMAENPMFPGNPQSVEAATAGAKQLYQDGMKFRDDSNNIIALGDVGGAPEPIRALLEQLKQAGAQVLEVEGTIDSNGKISGLTVDGKALDELLPSP